MNKLEWQQLYGFDDSDMERIELALSYGEKITAVNERPLDYEEITYNR